MTTEPRFGRYRVTATLGAGAMGEVFAAIDDVLGREVAVKTLRGTASGLAARLRDDRFRQEARAIAALHHPGVVAVFDLDLSANPPYLVMERVAGPSLKERLAAGALPANELRALGIQIARAIAAAHAAGILHRDVKPANILAAGPGHWKLADFGVAHVPDSSITMTGQFVGSPAYAPPEALIRGLSGAAGDIFGLGATLYEAAAGRWPRLDAAASGTVGGLLAPLPPLAELVPGLPAALAAAIDRAVAIEPDQRPTADELADALAGATSLAGVAPLVVAPAPPVVQGVTATEAVGARGGPGWMPWAAGGAIVLALVFAFTCHGAPSDAPTPPAALASPLATTAQPAAGALTEPPPGVDGRGTPTGSAAEWQRGSIDGKQRKDWNKIFEQLNKGHVDEARHKLDELERKYGATDDTRKLRAQLDAAAPHPDGPAPRDDDDRDDPLDRDGPPHPDPPAHGHRRHHGD